MRILYQLNVSYGGQHMSKVMPWTPEAFHNRVPSACGRQAPRILREKASGTQGKSDKTIFTKMIKVSLCPSRFYRAQNALSFLETPVMLANKGSGTEIKKNFYQ